MNPYHWRIVWSLVVTAVFLAVGGPYFPSLPSSSMESGLFWTNKAYPNQTFDVVFIGDSHIYRGIDPKTVEGALTPFDSLTVFNFGFSSAALDTSFVDAAIDLLNPQSKQRILVLGVNPSSVTDENMVNRHYNQEKNRPVSELLQRRYLNPYFNYFDPTSPATLRNTYRGKKEGYFQDHHMNGWVASNKYPKDVWKDYWMMERSYLTAKIDTAAIQRLLQRIQQWKAQGIEVIAFRPPAVEHFEKVLNEKSHYPEQAIITQLKAVGCHWIDVENRYSYETYDGSHLEEASAVRLSAYLGEKIRNYLENKNNPNSLPKWSSAQTFEEDILPPWTTTAATKIINSASFSGKRSLQLPPNAFSSTYVLGLDNLLFQNLYIRSSCWIKSETPQKEDGVVLVISIENEDGTLLWKGRKLAEQAINSTHWTKLTLDTAYQQIEQGAVLKVYVWNNGIAPVVVDDLEVQIEQQ